MLPEPSARHFDPPNLCRIEVRGHAPRVRDIRWREAIHRAVKEAHPDAPFPKPPPETKFDVKVTFLMTRADLKRPASDLDNFVKPVLDTVFTSQNVSSEVTGVLFPMNDTWVFRLAVEKVAVEAEQDQGAIITVAWHPPGTPDLCTALAPDSA